MEVLQVVVTVLVFFIIYGIGYTRGGDRYKETLFERTKQRKIVTVLTKGFETYHMESRMMTREESRAYWKAVQDSKGPF